MNALNKCIAGMLTLFLTGLYFPGNASCADPQMLAKVDENSITQHEPRVMTVEEKEIPKVAVAEKKQKGFNKKYLWIGLGAVLVGGIAAALASGGSSDGGDNDDSGEFRTRW
jgi:hypothetical protein